MNKLRLSPLRIAVDMYQHFFLSIQAMDQAMLTWALEIPTSKEIVEGQAHMPWLDGKRFHILNFPARNQARRRWWRRFSMRYNPLWHVAAFPLQWLWGGWAVGQKR